MNRAERREIARENQRWLRALWASDAPPDAKRLGAVLAAEAETDGTVTLSQVSATFVLTFPAQPTSARSR